MSFQSTNKLQIKKIKRFSRAAFNDLNHLWRQLSLHGYQMTETYFKEVLKDKNTHIFGLFDKKNIVGTISLIEVHKMRVYKGLIEDFVVDQNYRGRGLGKKLLLHTTKKAKQLGVKSLALTSEPERKVANQMYKKMGFKLSKVNYYKMQL